MKLEFLLVGFACHIGTSIAIPTPTKEVHVASGSNIQRRALFEDVCTIGYCTHGNGTTGGSGGTIITVSTLAEFVQAAQSPSKAIVVVNGALKGAQKVNVVSDTTIIGLPGSVLDGIGLNIERQSNVIIRNMKIANVRAEFGDAIALRSATNIWIDHCELSSDMNHGKDYYDGLLDITHACDWVTVSNTHFHDHYKTSLVGHSDSNGSEDRGHLHVTYASNYWNNINSRAPSIRFGTAHIINSYYSNVGSGVNSRMGAQVLIESTVFENSNRAVDSKDSSQKGSAVLNDVVLGGGSNTAPSGGLSSAALGYEYPLFGSGEVKENVMANAGQKLEVAET